jgi:hypothetical protein
MFRFATVEGRSALVDSRGCWFGVSKARCSAMPAPPMSAWLTTRCHAFETHL